MQNQIMNLSFALFLLASSFATGPQAREYVRLPLGPNMIGPESVAFDCEGKGPYVGVSDGRILKWLGSESGWVRFAVTSPYRSRLCDGLNDSPLEQYCGRPLGLMFDNSTCELYIADSSLGLLKVGRRGGIAISLATTAEGVPFRFANALDIDFETGHVYFTDTSTIYPRWQYAEAMATYDNTGRLMKYDPRTKEVTVLLRGLVFANGVALSKSKDFVLVAETTARRITRYWLTGPSAGTSDLFANLTGYPDNIHRNANGQIWVALNPSQPVKLDQFGKVVDSLNSSQIVDASDVSEVGNKVWIGSVVQRYLIYTTI